MSFLGDMFGGKPEQVAVQTISNDPPAYAQPSLSNIMSRAESIYDQPRQYYTGQGYVDFAAPTLEALNRGETRAMAGSPLLTGAQNFTNTAMAGGFLNPAANMLQSTAAGDYLSSGNPYLTAALQPAINQIQGQFSRAGRLGSGANMSAMTSALAPVYASNYATERQNQLAAQQAIGGLAQQDYANRWAAAQAAPTLAAADYDDISRLATFGQAREQKTAEQLADDMARFNFLQNEPLERLANYASLVRGGTLGSTTSQPVYANTTQGAIGNLALLGYGGKMAKEAGLFDFLGNLPKMIP